MVIRQKLWQEAQSHAEPHISIAVVMGVSSLPELHRFRMKLAVP